MASAPGRSGARRPENRVTARSKLPQKKCTGLLLPRNRDLNCWRTESTDNNMRQNFSTDFESYAACTRSSSKGIGLGISTGMCQIFTPIPADCSMLMNFTIEVRHRARGQLHSLHNAVARFEHELMPYEVEPDFKRPFAVGHS